MQGQLRIAASAAALVLADLGHISTAKRLQEALFQVEALEEHSDKLLEDANNQMRVDSAFRGALRRQR